MARHALTTSPSFGDAVRNSAPETDTSLPILQIAVNVVFGTPFLCSLFLAVRGNLYWGHHFAKDWPALGAYVWPMAGALGALWLGVSLVLHRVRSRRPAGALLVLAGSALLVLLNS